MATTEVVPHDHRGEYTPALREAIERKLADCREHGDCSDAALMPGEYCSNECVALASALAQADGKETKNEHAK